MAALAKALRRGRRRWYVFGAQAVVIHGRPRMTADVDVTVEADDVEALLADLGRAGLRLRTARLDERLLHARVLPMLHEATALPVDVVLAGPGLEQDFLSRAVSVDVGGTKVPVISPEDLLITKIIAGRAKDLDDALGVLAERGRTLDLGRVDDVLTQVEAALDRSDLRPVLRRLVNEAEAQANPPGHGKPRRSRPRSPPPARRRR